MRKALKWISIALAVPILLFIILSLLFYFPPFQHWAVKQATSYASEKTGMQISIAHVNLEFPLDLGVEGIEVIRQNDSLPQMKDTVASVGKAVVNVQLLPLLHKQVEIDRLELNDMKVNTANFIHEARVKGTISRLALQSHGIDLSGETVRINSVTLADAKVNIELSDTVLPDTSQSKNYWKIYADHLDIGRTDVTVHMPGDTLQVQAYLGKTVAEGGFFDLYKGLYRVKCLDWTGGRLKYDNRFETYAKGLDYNHLSLSGITLGIDSFLYCSPQLSMRLRACAFNEKSGLQVTQMAGPVAMDSLRLHLPSFVLRTPESSITAQFSMDLNAFDARRPGKMNATVHASIGKQDIMRFMQSMPKAFRQRFPNYPLQINGVVRGNMRRMQIVGASLKLPTAFTFKTAGYVENLADIDRLRADIDVNARTYDLSFVASMLDRELMKTIRIPQGISLNGHLKADRKDYQARFIAREGQGSLNGTARFNLDRMAYQAKLTAANLQIQHFVPNMGLRPFTGYVEADGVGTDFMSPRTRLAAKARVTNFSYGGYNVDRLTADVRVAGGKAHAFISSNNPLLKGDITLDALLHTKNIRATVSCDLAKADLYRLHLTDVPVTAAFCGHVDLGTDMKDYYKVQGLVSDISVVENGRTSRPEDIVLDVLTRRDTTHAVVDCGDFHLKLNGKGGYEHLMKAANRVAGELRRQYKNKYIDQVALRERLPYMQLYLSTGNDNFFIRLLNRYEFALKGALVDMTSSPVAGINGKLQVDSLVAYGVRLDTIRFNVASTDDKITYSGQIRNGKNNPQYVFNALFGGGMTERGTSLTARLYDIDEQLGIDLGMTAEMESGGIRAHILGQNTVLGYKEFGVNDDNYIFLGNDRRVSAKVKLLAADGTGIMLQSDDDNHDALQDITVSLNKFDLEKILSVIPYTPNISGSMNGDFHVIQTADVVTVSSAVSVDNMYYEHCPIGNVSTEFVYMPRSDGSHSVNGMLMSEGNEVATIEGSYDKNGYLHAALGMDHLPLQVVNGFIPEQIVGLRGYGDGELTVKGTLSKPYVDGEVYLDSSYIVSVPYGVEMRFANDPVRIKGSKLLFENFEMFANNASPLNLSGSFDFSDMDRMMLDVRMRAQNFELIDAKENARSTAYGKAFVNFFGFMQGPIDNLKMRGKLDVLGTTDMTYVLRDTELTTDNQLDELVKFTNFKDTAQQVVKRPPLTGLDMQLAMSIDEAAHITCMLNAEHSNYIDLMGGGDLIMSYNTVDNIRLTGRYTLDNGEMKYSLPVIPLKTFKIRNGSYIEFTGDALNPKLSITATERVKASVNAETGLGRSVEFDCGVILSRSLRSPGIQFVIYAPNDVSTQDELNTMTTEERGKIAIAMLVSGMYLTDGNTSSFSMNSALSSFLNTEINNIAGTAMRSMGLDIGMSVDNSTTSTGTIHTDYNFSFAKRLWNNRLSVIVGGKVSSGTETDQERNDTFFDNVELEYRLDQNSSKYLRLFYNNNTYDWLEGRIGMYGAGFMWKRKLQHFWDIFRFKSEKPVLPPEPEVKSDSATIKNNQKK